MNEQAIDQTQDARRGRLKAAIDALPEERKRRLEAWFQMQNMIAENLGIDGEAWFQYVEWAIQNPLDYGFLIPLADSMADTSGADGVEGKPERETEARKILGEEEQPKTPLLQQGPSLSERAQSQDELSRALYEGFVRNQVSGQNRKARTNGRAR